MGQGCTTTTTVTGAISGVPDGLGVGVGGRVGIGEVPGGGVALLCALLATLLLPGVGVAVGAYTGGALATTTGGTTEALFDGAVPPPPPQAARAITNMIEKYLVIGLLYHLSS